MKKKVCVLLPTYNERENIRIVIPWIFDQANKIETHELHVLVLDDNSPDGTQNVIRTFMASYPNLHLLAGEKIGLGHAYQRGIRYAINNLDPDLLIEMDGDLQHSPDLLPFFVTFANEGFDLIIGSRFVPGGNTPGFSAKRRFLSYFANRLIRLLGGFPNIFDCTSGFRCIKVDLIKKCHMSFFSIRGYAFFSSQLIELLRNGARTKEIPISFPNRHYGMSKLSFRDQVEFLINLFKIRFL
jgi:dolichol-phosphate mannosyltransferase